MAVVNEIVTEFDFRGSSKPLTNYNAALGQSIKLLGAGAVAIGAMSAAFTSFVLKTTAALDPMIQLSRTTGVAVEAIQELGFVASVSGSSLSAVQSTISSLSQKIGEAAQRGSEDFSRLGISVRKSTGEIKTADEVLEELRVRFVDLGLSMQEQQDFAGRLGIDASLLQLLNRTGSEIDRLRARARGLGVTTKEEADAAASLNDSMTVLKFGFEAVRNSIAVGLAPQMSEAVDGFVDLLKANKDLIQDGIKKFIEIVFTAFDALKRLTPAILGIAAAFGVWEVATLGLGTVLGVVFSPVVLITAGIAALLFILDDLIVAFNGGQSVIADFFAGFGIDIVPALQAVVDAFGIMMDGIKSIMVRIGSIFSDVFSAAIALIKGDFDGFFDHIISAFSKVVEFLSIAFQPISSLIGSALGLVGLGPDQQQIQPGNGAQSFNNVSNSVAQDVKIDIRTDNPRSAGESVRDSLQGQLSDAKTQFGRGGL